MTPAEIAGVLEASGRAMTGTLQSVPREVAAWHPAPGEWCVNECAGHIIEAERRGFAGRIRILLQGGVEPQLESWDQAAVSQAREDCDRAPAELASELSSLRRESVMLIRSIKPDQLSRAGTHPEVGRLTVDEVLHEWIHHDGNHLRQALANVQAYVWSDMGNARKFSSG